LAFTQIPSGNALLAPVPFFAFRYVESNPEFDNLGVNIELGFTFTNVKFAPRVYAGYAYFEGNDNSDITFWERINPFAEREASTAFNRLFTEWEYSNFIDIEGGLSNVWVGTVGARAQFTEKISAFVEAAHFEVVDPFERPTYRSPLFPGFFGAGTISLLSFVTGESDDNLGWEAELGLDYKYSEDLKFQLGYSHFFSGDGMEDGHFIDLNGLGFAGGLDDDDADYFFFASELKF
jgi:hypothetical protein